MDMTEDLFASTTFGKIALEKIKPQNPNFRLFCAGWLEDGPPETWETMKVSGAEFREAKTGPNKGKLSVMLPGTKRTVYIHKMELQAHEAAANALSH